MIRPGDLSKPEIASIYASVPTEVREAYQAFRKNYPYRQTVIDGLAWEYLVAGDSENALVILPGALTIPDVSWDHIVHFAQNYRVLAPVYPPARSMHTLANGVAEIMRREGIATAHVLGGSYGGLVAQVFVRRFPQSTCSLILSHTQAPGLENSGTIAKTARLLGIVPEGLLRRLMIKRMERIMPPDVPEAAFVNAMSVEMLHHRLSKADILASLWRMVDFYDLPAVPGDPEAWRGPTLIILSESDASTPEEVRNRLISLFPGAQVHLFQGTGHVSSILAPGEFQAVVGEFLRKAP